MVHMLRNGNEQWTGTHWSGTIKSVKVKEGQEEFGWV